MTPEEISDNFTDFTRRLEIINQNTSIEDKKSIHYKSLRNFIYHYKSFRKGKMKSTELLKEYLELIEKQEYNFNEEQSKVAYDLYVGPLGMNFYRRYINFSTEFSIFFEILFLGIPVYLIWIFLNSQTILFSILPLYFIYWIIYILKYKNKKIYGYRY